MATTKNKLKGLIKEEISNFLQELSRVDEPEGGPFGKVLFSRERTDSIDKTEPDTAVEEEFLIAFNMHQSDNSNNRLAKMFPSLLKIAKSGKYKKLLLPPSNTYVYRFVSGVPLELAAKRLGFTPQELLSDAGKSWYVDLKGKTYSSRAKIQSWTAYPSINAFNKVDIRTTKPRQVAILFEANTSDNNFLLSPTFSKFVRLFKNFTNEYEIIAQNPVKLSGAAFWVAPSHDSVYPNEAISQLATAARVKDYAKKPGKK